MGQGTILKNTKRIPFCLNWGRKSQPKLSEKKITFMFSLKILLRMPEGIPGRLTAKTGTVGKEGVNQG